MVILAVMDSPFMLPVWLGRFFGVLLQKAFDLLWDGVAASRPATEATGKTPEQYLLEEIAIVDDEEKKAELQEKLTALRHEASVSFQLLSSGIDGDGSPHRMDGYAAGTDEGSLSFIDPCLSTALRAAEVDFEFDVTSTGALAGDRIVANRTARHKTHRATLRQSLVDAQEHETMMLAQAAADLADDLQDRALERSQTTEDELESAAAVPDAVESDVSALLQNMHTRRRISLAFTKEMRDAINESPVDEHSHMGRIIHRAAAHLAEEVEDAANEALLAYEVEAEEPASGTDGIPIDRRPGQSVNHPHNYHERKTLTGEVRERRHFVVADAIVDQMSEKTQRRARKRAKVMRQLREAHRAVLRAKANAELAGDKKLVLSEEDALLLWRRVYLPVLMILTTHQIEVLYERRYGIAIFSRRPILLAARFRRLRAARERVDLAMKFGRDLAGEGTELEAMRQDVAAEIAAHVTSQRGARSAVARCGESASGGTEAEGEAGLEADAPISALAEASLKIKTGAPPCAVTSHADEPGLLSPTSAERARIVLAADGHTHINETLALKYLLTHSGAGMFPTLREEMLVCFLEEFLKDSTTWTWRDEAPIWRKIEKRDRLVLLGLDSPDDDDDEAIEAAAKLDEETLANANECEATLQNAVQLGISTLGRDLYSKSSLPGDLTARKWQVMEAKRKQESRVEKLRAKALRAEELEYKKSHPAEHKAKVEKERAKAKEAWRKSKLLRNGDKPPFHPCGLINAVQNDVSRKWQVRSERRTRSSRGHLTARWSAALPAANVAASP